MFYQLLDREYDYDANGRLSADLNKGIKKIEYNFLNLPFRITGTNNEEITYLYAADGRKVHKRYMDSNGNYHFTNYSGAYVYNHDQLDYVVHPEGIFSFTNGTNGEYWWHLKDHLGSVRMTINSEGQIMDCNEYYAFGGFMNDRVPSKNRLLYNSKELQSEAFSGYSLAWYDYGARTLNTDFGRFMSIDPLAQNYYATSPYVYCLNNPVKYVDPDGRWVESAWDLFSLASGVNSLVGNVRQGNYKAAIVDGLGVAVDAFATIVPGVPGGVGALRAADKAVDAVKAKKATDRGIRNEKKY